jgi:predicted transcriptional regulator
MLLLFFRKISVFTKTKYAIIALVVIAKNKDDQPISISKISEKQNIPLKFLESILTELKNARILKSKKKSKMVIRSMELLQKSIYTTITFLK